VASIGKECAIQTVPCRHVSHFCHNLFYLYSPFVRAHAHVYMVYARTEFIPSDA